MAEASPADEIFSRAVHDSVTPVVPADTVTVAGVVPPAGVTERKLPHVESDTAIANDDAPAVLRTRSV